MAARASDVLHEALSLLPEERAEIAAELLASLDGPSDVDVEAAWLEEIEKRAHRALSGESQAIERDEARARIARRLSRP
jgi:Arc/MetJ-type ribon-helix-helix transcriptional regulator